MNPQYNDDNIINNSFLFYFLVPLIYILDKEIKKNIASSALFSNICKPTFFGAIYFRDHTHINRREYVKLRSFLN